MCVAVSGLLIQKQGSTGKVNIRRVLIARKSASCKCHSNGCNSKFFHFFPLVINIQYHNLWCLHSYQR